MSNNSLIQLKRSSVSGNVPDSANLSYGELAINYADGKLFFKNSLDGVDSIYTPNTFQTVNVNSTLLYSNSPSTTLSLSTNNYITLRGIGSNNTIVIGETLSTTVVPAAFDKANIAYTTAQAAFDTANSGGSSGNTDSANAYTDSVVTANAVSTNSVISTANTNLKLYTDGKITSNAAAANSVINTNISANVATLRGEISANAVSTNSVISTANTNNILYTDGKITSNAASANAVINTNISANVATLRGEISANAVSTNSVISTANTNNILYTDGKITSNAAAANSVINTNISANVATLRGEISANAVSTNSVISTANTNIILYTDGKITSNAASANSIINTNISANVATLRGEISANAVSTNSVISTANTNLKLYTDGKITSNAASANAVINTNISANVATLRGEISANAVSTNSVISTANTNNILYTDGKITSNTNTLRGEIASNVSIVYNQANAAFEKANTSLQNTTSILNGSLTLVNGKGVYANHANLSANVSIGTYLDISNVASIPSNIEGRLYYDAVEKCLTYYNESAQHISIGQTSVIRVWNNTGSTIGIGKCVYISGTSSSNNVPSIALAQANSQISSEVIGLTTVSITSGGYGYVAGFGKIDGLDTSLYTEGQELFLSATTPGEFTGVIPDTPNIPTNIGYISNVDLTNGVVLVNVHLMEGKNKTDGSVLFARDSAIDQDNIHLFWDYTNNRLGINTTSPQANLHVAGDGIFSGNVVISGNLQISNAQSITTSELTVGGNTIILNSEVTGVPTSNATILINRGSSTNTYIRWDESIDEWTIFEGSGNPGHIISSEKTIKTWEDYTAQPAYEKLTHSIGADLSNSINEIAKAGYSTANTAVSTGYYANTAWNQANSAYALANTSVQNTGGTILGDLTVSGSIYQKDTAVSSANTSLATITQTSIDSFAASSFRTAKYTIQVTDTISSRYHSTDIILIHNGSTVQKVEYATVTTSGELGTFDADINTGSVRLLFTATNTNNRTIRFNRTLIES